MSKMFVIEKIKIYKIKFNFFLQSLFDLIFFRFFSKKKESLYVIIKLNWIQSQKLIKFKHQILLQFSQMFVWNNFFLAFASPSTIIHFTFIHFKNILTYYYFISNNFYCCCSNLTNLTASFLIAPVVCVSVLIITSIIITYCMLPWCILYIRYSRVENL